jgi:glycosyltransferase involved in cell wall biosynthesis
MTPQSASGRILCLTKYDATGPSTRYRFSQFLPGLEARGWDITVYPLLPGAYVRDLYSGKRWGVLRVLPRYLRRLRDLLKAGRYDLCWIQYELFPWAPGFAEWCLRRLDIPYVVDYDDAVFHSYDLHPSAGVRWLFGSKLDHVMAGAAAVVVGNEYLASRALAAGARRVEIIPTVVDLEKYPPAPAPSGRAGVYTIGWIGSPSTQAYLSLVQQALAQVCAGGTGRLLAVGPKAGFQLAGVTTERVAWSEASEVADLQRCDVGIMPLPGEDAWAKGKCGFKLIQYMGCGLPVVAAAVGANRDIVLEGETGFLATTSEDWVRSLTYLRAHPEEGQAMGQAGRQRMVAQYSLQSQLPRLDALFRALTGATPWGGASCAD